MWNFWTGRDYTTLLILHSGIHSWWLDMFLASLKTFYCDRWHAHESKTNCKCQTRMLSMPVVLNGNFTFKGASKHCVFSYVGAHRTKKLLAFSLWRVSVTTTDQRSVTQMIKQCQTKQMTELPGHYQSCLSYVTSGSYEFSKVHACQAKFR